MSIKMSALYAYLEMNIDKVKDDIFVLYLVCTLNVKFSLSQWKETEGPKGNKRRENIPNCTKRL